MAATGKTTTGSPRPEASAREAHEPGTGAGEARRGRRRGNEAGRAGRGDEPDEAAARAGGGDRRDEGCGAGGEAAGQGDRGTAPGPPGDGGAGGEGEATPETEETEEDAPGAKTRAAGQGGETGPNAAKTRSREDAPAASAEETTRASPPMAHPTATLPAGRPRPARADDAGDQRRDLCRGGQSARATETDHSDHEDSPPGRRLQRLVSPPPPHGGAPPPRGRDKRRTRRERKGGPRKVFAKRSTAGSARKPVGRPSQAEFQGALAGTTAGATIGGPAGVSERKRLAGDFWGESGRGGFGDNQTGFSVRFQTPLSHAPPPPGWAQAVLRSDCTAKTAASVNPRPEQRSGPSAFRASFHEGRGPSLKDGLRPEPPSVADHDPLRREVAASGRFVPCRGGGRGACGAVCAPTPPGRSRTPRRPGTLRSPSRVIGRLGWYAAIRIYGWNAKDGPKPAEAPFCMGECYSELLDAYAGYPLAKPLMPFIELRLSPLSEKFPPTLGLPDG